MSKSIKGSGLRDQLVLRDVAREAIHAQTDKDQAKESASSVADHFLICAKHYGLDYEAFLAACKAEEQFMKSPEAKADQWDKIPDVWKQTKSNIKRAMEAGIDPNNYDTMRKYRDALNEHRKENAKDETQKAAEQTSESLQSMDTGLAQVVAAIAATVEKTPENKVDEAKAQLEQVLENLRVLNELVPAKPKRKKASKKKVV